MFKKKKKKLAIFKVYSLHVQNVKPDQFLCMVISDTHLQVVIKNITTINCIKQYLASLFQCSKHAYSQLCKKKGSDNTGTVYK